MAAQGSRRSPHAVGLVVTALTALLATLLSPAHGAADGGAAGPSPHIVGGSDADQVYPFIVAFTSGEQTYCAGAVLTEEWVVTAAHCVQDRSPEDVELRIGSTLRSSGGFSTTGAEFHPHPDFDWDAAGSDIGLVRLSEPTSATPIELSEPAEPGTPSRLLGWGRSCPEPDCTEQPETLQQLDTEVIEAAECADIEPESELCTDNPGGDSGACYGDSGGPQLIETGDEWRLAGVTSRPGYDGDSCAQGPSIYTDVVAYADWIADTTGDTRFRPDTP
ncbi:serine protease [Haloechinothrix sp. YIM 98757]|uniref:Serine protease n=1 Tax=Haloechinothrix aidingensis TaxID=2752311 RepID=A0A838A9J6_9PSEU|nr:serine protease [Haloechinothrix aidingensis]MBA0125411.1 serine protease [Haloechinothrix aidingensis]